MDLWVCECWVSGLLGGQVIEQVGSYVSESFGWYSSCVSGTSGGLVVGQVSSCVSGSLSW